MATTTSAANESTVSILESQLDEQFIVYMLEIDGRYKSMMKQDRVRVEQWSKVLCHANSSVAWKKNRNLYSMQLLDCVLNNKLVKPFSMPPPARATKTQNVNQSVQWRRGNNQHSPGNDGLDIPHLTEDEVLQHNDFVLPMLNKTQVKSSLSIRFKHLNLEVDQQKIVTQLTTQGNNDSMVGDEQSQHHDLQSYNSGEEVMTAGSFEQESQQQLRNHPRYAHQQEQMPPSSHSQRQEDLDENPRPQQPMPTSSGIRSTKDRTTGLKRVGSRHKSLKSAASATVTTPSETEENTQQNFQERQAELMLRQAEEQLKQYNMPMQQTDVQRYKQDIFDLKEENRTLNTQVVQLETQIEVQQIGEKHLREQMEAKDQMLHMQEDLLNQLYAEVDNLKQMLNAQSVAAEQAQQKQLEAEELHQFQTEETVRMMNTAKAQVPQIIKKDAISTKLNVNRGKGKQLIVPDEIKLAQRYRRREEQELEKTQKRKDANVAANSDLLKSHISLSDCDDRSLHLVEQSPRVVVDNHLQSMSNGIDGATNEDGATLQLQNYIQSVDDNDLNFLQDSMLLSQQQQSQPPTQHQLHQYRQEDQYDHQQLREQNRIVEEQPPENAFAESSNTVGDDRFLEEVLLSRKPDYSKKQVKNEFLPKSTAAATVLQPIKENREMSLQDLSQDISAVLPQNETNYHQQQTSNHHNQVCNKTVDCSCGCEDDESFAQVNRTQQDYRNMKRLKEQKEFFEQINTEIASCTQDNSQCFEQSRVTSNGGSPARLLDQLLASQGASAFQPQFNYKQHLQQNREQQRHPQEESKQEQQSTAIPMAIHDIQNNNDDDEDIRNGQYHSSQAEMVAQQQREEAAGQDMPLAQSSSLATESQFERFYTDLIT